MTDVISCQNTNFQWIIKQTITTKTDLRANFTSYLKVCLILALIHGTLLIV